MQNGNLELEYNVKNRLNKKTVRVIKPLLSPMELKEMASAISSHAKKQQELLQYFIEHQEPIPLKELLEFMNTSSGTVKSLVSKGPWLKWIKKYTVTLMKTVCSKNPFPLH